MLGMCNPCFSFTRNLELKRLPQVGPQFGFGGTSAAHLFHVADGPANDRGSRSGGGRDRRRDFAVRPLGSPRLLARLSLYPALARFDTLLRFLDGCGKAYVNRGAEYHD